MNIINEDTPSQNKTKIISRFFTLLKENNLTQDQIHHLTNLSYRTISRYANEGHLTRRTAREISLVFKVSMFYLLGETDDPKFTKINEDTGDIDVLLPEIDIERIILDLSKYEPLITTTLNDLKKEWLFLSESKKANAANLFAIFFLMIKHEIIDQKIQNKTPVCDLKELKETLEFKEKFLKGEYF